MARLSAAHRNQRSTTSYSTEQDRRRSQVKVKHAIACPDCGAGVGESCVSPDGKPKVNHNVRVRLATRLHNEQMQGWDLVLWVKSVTHKERRAALLRAGASYSEIAEVCGVPGHSVRDWLLYRNPPLTPAGVKFAEWLREQVPR